MIKIVLNEIDFAKRQKVINQTGIELKSLILAQIERWRHALHMQVERAWGLAPKLVANG